MTHEAFHTPNLPHEITVMIKNTGQMCTVNYSDRPKKKQFGKINNLLRDNFFVTYSN